MASLIKAIRSQAVAIILAMLQIAIAENSKYSPSTTLTNGSSYDYIIVGGGTAGSVVATRLAEENKYTVLLIEAGGDPPPETVLVSLVPTLRNSPVNWFYTAASDGYTEQCHINKVLELGIGKMLGGTSELNYMIYSRGHVLHYDRWSNITNDDTWKWPHVLPYYIKSEKVCDDQIMSSSHRVYHGYRGPVQVSKIQNKGSKEYLQAYIQAGNEMSIDGDEHKLGYYESLITANNGRRQGGASAYLSRVNKNPFLIIAKNSLATKIIFDKRKNAVAVKVINNKNQTVIVNALKEIIITAGAVKSPQLLMLSGIGPKTHLKENKIKVIVDSPEVGRNFHDHTAVTLVYKTNRPTQPESSDPGEYIAPLFIGFSALNKSCDYPDYHSMNYIVTHNKSLLQLCSSTLTFNSQICQYWLKESNNSEALVTLLSNTDTKSRGYVKLANADPRAQPRIVTGFFSNDKDLESMVDYIEDYIKVEKTDFFKNINATRIDATKCNGLKPGSRKYWRCYSLCMMASMGHFGGTCAMGTVVDGHLRVYGVQRLRVADASVMPQIVSGNIQQPVMMIAEKAAQCMINDYEITLY